MLCQSRISFSCLLKNNAESEQQSNSRLNISYETSSEYSRCNFLKSRVKPFAISLKDHDDYALCLPNSEICI